MKPKHSDARLYLLHPKPLLAPGVSEGWWRHFKHMSSVLSWSHSAQVSLFTSLPSFHTLQPQAPDIRQHPQPLDSCGEQLSHLHLLRFYYHSFPSPIHDAHMHIGVQILARMWRKKNTYLLLVDCRPGQSWWISMQRFLRKLRLELQSAQLYLSCAGLLGHPGLLLLCAQWQRKHISAHGHHQMGG